VSDIESISKDGIRVARICTTQIVGEDYIHRTGVELTRILGEMEEPALVLDLSEVTMMTSAMIGKMVFLNTQCKQKKIGFSVCSLGKEVAEAIQLTQIDKILPIFDSQEDAIAAANEA